jgi:hypothetical protein
MTFFLIFDVKNFYYIKKGKKRLYPEIPELQACPFLLFLTGRVFQHPFGLYINPQNAPPPYRF